MLSKITTVVRRVVVGRAACIAAAKCLNSSGSLEWGPHEGLGPGFVEVVRRIKSQDGPDLILSGSSTLTSILLEHGLTDEVVLAVNPVLLGTGKRFFSQGTPARAFELISTQALPSGIILSTYKGR